MSNIPETGREGSGSSAPLYVAKKVELDDEDRKNGESGRLIAYPWDSGEPALAWEPLKQRSVATIKGLTWFEWVVFFLPCVGWLRTYKIRDYLLNDFIAGITVGFMVVPQGMSYATTAGLPSVYGLYGAFVPVLVYSLFGSSRQLGVGPVTITSLLISQQLGSVYPDAAAISNHNAPTAGAQTIAQNQYNIAAIQVAFLASLMYTAIGVFQLGFITNFLSHAVIGGFTSGAAITIGGGQMQYILGYSIKPTYQRIQDILQILFDRLDTLVWQEFVMGMTILFWMLFLKEMGNKYPKFGWCRALAPITGTIIGLVAVIAGNLDSKGIKVVGPIPQGPPPFTGSWWFPMDFGTLFPIAILIFIVDLLESTSIARALAKKNNYKIEWNSEIRALGYANFMGSLFNCYTTTGSFSRSSVNNLAGAKTQLAGFITSFLVLFTLLFLTPLLERMPYNTIGAIVITAVTSLFEYEQMIFLWKVNKLDWCVWWASFLGTMFYSVELGLGIAIGMAVIITIYESAFPNTVVLGRIPGTTVHRNRKQYRESETVPGILSTRVDAAIYFANSNWILERFEKYVSRASEIAGQNGTTLQYFIMDATPVTHVDATGCQFLSEFILDLWQRKIQFVLVNPSYKVLRALERAGIIEMFGREWIFVRTNDAVSFCKSQLRGASPATAFGSGKSLGGLDAVPSVGLTPQHV